MRQPEGHEAEAKKRPDRPRSPTQEQDTLPTLCGPGCSCGAPGITNKWKIVIILVVVSAATIALIYKEMM